MLTLLLLRHAKAEVAVGRDDFARNLTEAGERDAGRIGAFLVENGLLPDLALVSASVRTSRTVELVVERLRTKVGISRDRTLYNADEARVRNHVERAGADVCRLLVVGHNPAIMELAVSLARDGDLIEIERLRGRFPPGALAVLDFEAEDWPTACASGGRLDALVFPEDLVGGA